MEFVPLTLLRADDDQTVASQTTAVFKRLHESLNSDSEFVCPVCFASSWYQVETTANSTTDSAEKK
jgi:hypothetical protein